VFTSGASRQGSRGSGEIEELHAAARNYRSIGETDAADTVERQADVLRRVLSPDL